MAKKESNKGSHEFTEMSSGLIHNLKQEFGKMPEIASPESIASPKQASGHKANLKQLNSLWNSKGGN